MEEIARDLVSHRIADQLSPHHDSQFSAFSTEVLDRTNQKHNRSSSPFTTLAEQAERKVVITGAGQPNYWSNTWFRADAYNAIFGTMMYAIKVFGLFSFWKFIRLKKAPGDLSRTGVYTSIWREGGKQIKK